MFNTLNCSLKNTLKISSIIAVTFLSTMNAMAMDAKHNDHSSTLHNIQLKLNQAVEMAAKGSNLIIIGQMGKAEKTDATFIKDGIEMIAHSRSLINKVMKGNAMRDLHLSGITGTNEMMMRTHNIGSTALNYINYIDVTNAVSKSAMHEGMSHKNMDHKAMGHKELAPKANAHNDMKHHEMAKMKKPDEKTMQHH